MLITNPNQEIFLRITKTDQQMFLAIFLVVQPSRVNPACQMPPQGSLDYFGHLLFVLKVSTDPQGRTVGHQKENNFSCQKIAQIMQGNPLITTYIFSWGLLPETRAEINVTRLFIRLSVTFLCVTHMKARLS